MSDPTGITNGFPTWYEDEGKQQLGLCADGNDPYCVVVVGPPDPYDLTKGLSLSSDKPVNFPGESFYFVADADKLTTPGCPAANIAPGKLTYRAAIEGAFVTADAEWGQQITFTRIKIVATGLCPNKAYTFEHPYGVDTLTADGAGAITANRKVDIGCGGAQCDFRLALAGPVLGGFLQWDPITDAPKGGYLGDGAVGTPHKVVGSPFGINYFALYDGAPGPTALAVTTLFTVGGRTFDFTDPLPVQPPPSLKQPPSVPVPAGTTPSVSTDLQVKGSAKNGGPAVGSSDTYTWEIKNAGKSAASGVRFKRTLPNSLGFQSATPSSPTCTGVQPQSFGTLTCNIPTLAANQTAVITVNVTVKQAGTIISNGSVSFNGTDTQSSNDSFSVSIKAR